MVAFTCDIIVISHRLDYNSFKRFRRSAVCIYIFLRVFMNKIKKFQTIFILAIVALIAYGIFYKSWLLYVCSFFILLPFICPQKAEQVQKFWLKFGSILGRVNTAILLGFVFYVALMPLAFFYRFFNKKAVEHFKKNNKTTLFEDIEGDFLKEDFKKLW
jgi:Saxitoxin biosynthesis operon protein SxtJ